ncbi:hypothetical protein [Thiolinea disciformis]|uniref:hypothetical protein n=1 Tax=Thiolinea disciformis TaxID=125614 RepID=UPI00037BCD33|nr:hypothetical protein [Thiolinea disciformis]
MSASSLENCLVRISMEAKPPNTLATSALALLIKPDRQAAIAYLISSKRWLSAIAPKPNWHMASDGLNIYLTHQATQQTLTLKDEILYGLPDSELAFGIIELQAFPCLNQLDPMAIIDSLSAQAEAASNNFQLMSVKRHAPSQTQVISLLSSQQNRADQEQETFISLENLDPLSLEGALVVLNTAEQQTYLKSIVLYKSVFNELQALKLSASLDSINKYIKTIKSDLPLISVAPVELEDDLSLSSTLKASDNLLSDQALQDALVKVVQEESALKQQRAELTAKYLHLAGLAEHTNSPSLKVSALHKALEWDKEALAQLRFAQALKTNNKAAIGRYHPLLLSEKIKKYDALISLAQEPEQQINLLKQALQQITNEKLYKNDLSETSELKQKIDVYAATLNQLYESNELYRDIPKYKQLADFYFTLSNQHQNPRQQAAYYYQLTQALLEKAPMSQLNEALAKEIAQQLEALRQRQVDVILEKEQAYERAKALINSQEDKDIRELLVALAEESKEIKKSDLQQENIQLLLIGVLSSLNQNLDQQNSLSSKTHSQLEQAVNQVKAQLLALEATNKDQLSTAKESLKESFKVSYEDLVDKITHSAFNEQQKKDLSDVLAAANMAFVQNLDSLRQDHTTASKTLEELYSLNREHRSLLANIHSTLNDSNEIAQMNQANSLGYYEKFGNLLLEQQNSILSALSLNPIEVKAEPKKKSSFFKMTLASILLLIILVTIIYLPMATIAEQTRGLLQAWR